ncbi:hypothetical protein K9N08_04630 [Candidatus Gracilibacteria bacterium]|nr:hypothetical protein [Candidatus Gracilibacteria bacterium]MCF7856792.1 hypothetical protein [Candidatus Gracilibacteria bacterium]MCF7897070.1 hypothetical protein [Candidatus Gracilibacteria bacterium]
MGTLNEATREIAKTNPVGAMSLHSDTSMTNLFSGLVLEGTLDEIGEKPYPALIKLLRETLDQAIEDPDIYPETMRLRSRI